MAQNSKMAALICIFDLFNLYNSIDLDPDPILNFCDVIKSRGIPQISRDFRGNPGTTWHHMAPSRTSCTSWHLILGTSWHHTFGHHMGNPTNPGTTHLGTSPHWHLILGTSLAPHIWHHTHWNSLATLTLT